MATKVIMPQLGESVVEGTVSRWLKREGDTVNEYEALLEVSTDKVDTEVPSPASGTVLKIYVEEGETVQAGVLLAVIGEPGEPIPEADEGGTQDHHGHGGNGSKQEPQPVAAPAKAMATAQSSGSGYTGHITPVVARMVAEHNIDLSQIKGTGRGGRITKKDVLAYLKQREQGDVQDLPPWEQPGDGELFKPTDSFAVQTKAQPAPPPAKPVAPAASPAPPSPTPQGTPGELVQLSNIRRAIAEHMVRSKLHTSPHVSTIFEIDMGAVLDHYHATKPIFAKQGVRLTLTAYFMAASVVALRENPYINSQWTDEGIYLHHAMNIGMAVAIPDGLIVPVIKNAQDLNLMGLARAVTDLAERARNKQLHPDEVQGGTFTITNHGVSGSLFATPIINQPQVAILGIGKLEKRVKVINDAIAIRPMLYASLTFDHRVIDGATGDAFMASFQRVLENWRE